MRSTPLYKKIQFYCLNSAAFQLGALSNPTYANDYLFSFLNCFSFKDILPFFFFCPLLILSYSGRLQRELTSCAQDVSVLLLFIFQFLLRPVSRKRGKKKTQAHTYTPHTQKKKALLVAVFHSIWPFFCSNRPPLHYFSFFFFCVSQRTGTRFIIICYSKVRRK